MQLLYNKYLKIFLKKLIFRATANDYRRLSEDPLFWLPVPNYVYQVYSNYTVITKSIMINPC